jgi:hypothetical protein
MGGAGFTAQPTSIRTAKQDIVAVSSTGTILVLIGSGDGSFRSVFQRRQRRDERCEAGVGDFDGDGKPVLALFANSTVWVLLGKGDGTFESAISTPASSAGDALTVADVNRDGCTTPQ